MDEQNTKDLLAELEALVDKYKDGTPDGTDAATEQKDAERMAQLTDEINRRSAEADKAAQNRAAQVSNARAAIEAGAALRVDSVPLSRSANAARTGVAGIYDTTDYDEAEKRGFLKGLASELGVRLTEGNDLTDAERAAVRHGMEQRASFTVTTGNTDAVVPKVLKNEIISLIDGSTAMWSDVTRDTMKNQYELIRHVSIDKGDAAETAEGAAPADDEQNTFKRISLSGVEGKKRVKLTRKMTVQSIDGFSAYIVREVGGRLAVFCNSFVNQRLSNADLGMAAANKFAAATAGTLSKTDFLKAFGLLKTFGNPAPKGTVVYASQSTIWNQIAAIEDKNGRAYFVNEKDEDPTTQGRIFGSKVKKEDGLADGVIRIGYPDLFRSNLFDGPVVEAVKLTDGSWNTAIDGYVLVDGGLAVPEAFAEITVGTAAAGR